MTDNMPSENILNRIKALLNLAENNSNLNEASAAFAKAQKLLAEYNLTAENLQDISTNRDEICENLLDTEFGNRSNWYTQLVSVVCKANFVKPHYDMTYINGRKARRFMLVGRKTNVDTTIYMIHNLAAQLERICDKEYETEKYFTRIPGKSWKNSWYLGAINTIAHNLQENIPYNNPAHNALVISRENEIKEFLSNYKFTNSGGFGNTKVYADPYNSGKASNIRVQNAMGGAVKSNVGGYLK